MGITIQESDSWSLDYAIESYNQTKEIQGYILWRSKKELKHGEIEEFYKRVNISKPYASRIIKHFEARVVLSNVAPEQHLDEISEQVALEIVRDKENPLNDMPASNYAKLKGKTPQEKVEYMEKVKEHTGKDKITRNDISDFRNKDIHLSEKEAIAQTNKEFGEDYYKLCSGGVGDSLGVFNIGFEIHKFDKDWNSIKRILSKAAHPDKGGSDIAMSFISMLNKVFKDKKITVKETKLKKDMTDRITNLMGVTNER